MLLKLKCQECNGWLESTKDENIYVCEFCGTRYMLSNKEIQICENTDMDANELYAQLCKSLTDRRKELEEERKIVPFVSTDKETTLKRFNIAADTEFAPPEFRQVAKVKDIIHMFIPMYVFEVSGNVRYSLEIGHTEYRRVWNEYKNKYVNEPYTAWSHEGGYLNGTWEVLTTGINMEGVIFPLSKALSDMSNRKEFVKFGKEIADRATAITEAKDYSESILNNQDIFPAVPKTDAWKREGAPMLKKEIDKAVKKRYSAKIRNVHWDGDIHENKTVTVLYPATFVVYDYKDMEDRIVVLDGVEEKYYRGVFPKSTKKNVLRVVRWGVPLLLSIVSGMLYALGLLDNSSEGLWVPILSVALGIVIWFWFGKIKGTGGDTNCEAAKNNRKANTLFGIISILLTIIIIFFIADSFVYEKDNYRNYYNYVDSYVDSKFSDRNNNYSSNEHQNVGTYETAVPSIPETTSSSATFDTNTSEYKGMVYYEVGDGAYYYLKLDQPIVFNGYEHEIIIFPNIVNGGLDNSYLGIPVTVVGDIYEDYHGVLSIDLPAFYIQ